MKEKNESTAVFLLKDHRLDGRDLKAGMQINVVDDIAQTLISLGIAEAVKASGTN